MSNQPLSFRIRRGGRVEFIYSDAAASLLEKPGVATVKRASHVEPHPSRIGWIADMRPSGGPILGQGSEWQPQSELPLDYVGDLERQFIGRLDPFPTRQAALDAEVAWLKAHRGL